MTVVRDRRSYLLPGAGASECRALVAACLDAPLDAAPRACLSDWCLENGLDRPVTAFGLVDEMLKAADDWGSEWEPPKTPAEYRNGVLWSAERPRRWFDLNRRGLGWLDRLYAVAGGRLVIAEKLPPEPNGERYVMALAMTACELAAARLLSPTDRDRHIQPYIPLEWPVDRAYTVDRANSTEAWLDRHINRLNRIVMYARGASAGDIEGGLCPAVRAALHGDKPLAYWADPKSRLRPYRMVRVLRRHLGLEG